MLHKSALQLIQEAKINNSKILDIGCCGLTEIPPELFELEQLETLIISNRFWDVTQRKWVETTNTGVYNLLSGKLPEKFKWLKNLKHLYLGGSGDIYKKTRNLGFVFIYGDYWQINDSSILQELPNLQTLGLSNNKISNIYFLEKLNKLQFLDISNNKIQNIYPLQTLIKLCSLNISNNQIQNIYPLQFLIKLQTLDISNNQVLDIYFLEKLVGLKTLDISNNQIRIIPTLRKIPRLKTLYINNNTIDDIRPLTELEQLQLLDP